MVALFFYGGLKINHIMPIKSICSNIFKALRSMSLCRACIQTHAFLPRSWLFIYVLVAPLLFTFLLFYMQKSQVQKLLKSEYRYLSGGTQEGVEVLTAYAIQGYFSLFYHASVQH